MEQNTSEDSSSQLREDPSAASNTKVDPYILMRRKFKIWYRHKKPNRIYNYLVKNPLTESSYETLYFQDLLISVTKILRDSINYKEPSLEKQVLGIKVGRESLQNLYRGCLTEHRITHEETYVKDEIQQRASHILTIIINFLLQTAHTYRCKDLTSKALQYYERAEKIVRKIIDCSPSNYKLARKSTEFYISYGSYLCELSRIDLAIQMLKNAIKAETNAILLLDIKLKARNHWSRKSLKISNLNRIFGIFYNLMICSQLKGKQSLFYACLCECVFIGKMRDSLHSKDRKNIWNQELRIQQGDNQTVAELYQISAAYFDRDAIEEDISVKIRGQKQANSGLQKQFTNVEISKVVIEPEVTRKTIRKTAELQRSCSLKPQSATPQIYRGFAMRAEMLLLGTDLQRSRAQSGNLIKTALLNDQPERKALHFMSKANQHKSKISKQRKVVNAKFRKISTHLEYSELQGKLVHFWEKETLDNYQRQEKMCLLKYKSQFIKNKELNEQGDPNERLQVIEKKNNFTMKDQSKKENKSEEPILHGLNLFKQIMLKHAKKFGLKKSEVLNSLKKPERSRNLTSSKSDENGINFLASPNASVNFLIDQIDNFKQKRVITKKTESNEHRESDRVLLMKGTDVETPNLFLSYFRTHDQSQFSRKILDSATGLKIMK